jgi:hypothetical protein
MWRRITTSAAVIAASTLAAGCASTCGANADKLANLQRGMSTQEASAVMGCPGSALSLPDNEGIATLEWTGPGSLLTVTDLDFRDDKLLYYTSRSKYGF